MVLKKGGQGGLATTGATEAGFPAFTQPPGGVQIQLQGFAAAFEEKGLRFFGPSQRFIDDRLRRFFLKLEGDRESSLARCRSVTTLFKGLKDCCRFQWKQVISRLPNGTSVRLFRSELEE